ncbi:hypothetical protein [Bacillus xiapuensis]|nr:hypothetical protein [Bacillus xiapuensis]
MMKEVDFKEKRTNTIRCGDLMNQLICEGTVIKAKRRRRTRDERST